MVKQEPPVTVRLPEAWLWVVILIGAGLGVGAAFTVGPVADGMIRLFDGAPGPLGLAAALPLVWAVPVLALVGAVAGAWVAGVWRSENPVVEVGADGVVVHDGAGGRHVARAQLAEVFTDGRELVLRGADGGEHVRTRVDSGLAERLRSAFEQHGYPWRGTVDPHEAAYTVWVDNTPDLDERAHALLRKRRRAIADDRTGAADEAREELRAQGISVRDRGKVQQYRTV
ncbi:PH domain-containing protein [Streptomyces sp. NPDC059556]|uniref:YqeB family protein n=1 Tax=Streptomyces sp. NPDC059556 TaxID=3346863 RepID=UPI0036CE82BB